MAAHWTYCDTCCDAIVAFVEAERTPNHHLSGEISGVKAIVSSHGVRDPSPHPSIDPSSDHPCYWMLAVTLSTIGGCGQRLPRPCCSWALPLIAADPSMSHYPPFAPSISLNLPSDMT